MKILVDVEETRSLVPRGLVALGVDINVVRLPVGDYVVAPDAVVERKAVGDLHESVASGRIWSQLHALRCHAKARYLVVEGARLDLHRVSAHGIRGALLQVDEGGVTVVRSTDPRDTALWLFLIAVRRQRECDGLPPRRRGRRRMVVSSAGVLATAPGISPTAARRLLDRFGSIAAIANASEMELQEVEGIGPTRASSLAKLLR